MGGEYVSARWVFGWGALSEGVQQQCGRALAERRDAHADGREWWIQESRDGNVVEARDADARWYVDPRVAQRAQRADRHRIVRGEDHRRRLRHLEQRTRSAPPPLLREVTAHIERVVEL